MACCLAHRAHPVISISAIKRAHDLVPSDFPSRHPPPPPPLPTDPSGSSFLVSDVLDHRRHNGTIQFRVRWQGYSAADDTWEDWLSLEPLTVGEPEVLEPLRRYLASLRNPPTRPKDPRSTTALAPAPLP